MEIKFYSDEIVLIPEGIDEVGKLNDFFNRNNKKKSTAYSAKATLCKSENPNYQVSITLN